jgi:hypothetical protein
VLNTCALLSGGLRYAATTGYYLTALQAEIRFIKSRNQPLREPNTLSRR